jgi:valyl-tRNA synthetase
LAPWPELSGLADLEAESEIGWVIDLVSAIRSVRAEMNIPGGTAIPLVLVGVSSATDARAGRWSDMIKRLARLSSMAVATQVPRGAVQLVVRGEVVALPLNDIIDLAAERARLEKELARVNADIARIDGKLSNEDFVRRAPEDVVDGEREKRTEADARRLKIIEALGRLKGMA